MGYLVDELGGLLSAVTFLVFGAVMLGPALGDATVAVVLYAVLSLTLVRLVPVGIAMLGTGASRQTVGFLGWFGPRGLASIVFTVILAEERLPHEDVLVTTAVVTVALSVLAHGATAAPFANRYADWFESHPKDDLPSARERRDDARALAPPRVAQVPLSRRWRVPCRGRRGGRAVECGGLENRYGSLGSSRVQIPPSPLKQAGIPHEHRDPGRPSVRSNSVTNRADGLFRWTKDIKRQSQKQSLHRRPAACPSTFLGVGRRSWSGRLGHWRSGKNKRHALLRSVAPGIPQAPSSEGDRMTIPDIGHCVGKRSSPLKERYAETETMGSVQPAPDGSICTTVARSPYSTRSATMSAKATGAATSQSNRQRSQMTDRPTLKERGQAVLVAVAGALVVRWLLPRDPRRREP